MPTYVYACDTCGAQFEQFQSFSDDPIRTCPSCAGAVRRVFQPVGIVFKGSGWYITDSRNASSATVGGEDSAKGAAAPVAKAEPASDATSSASNANSTSSASNTTSTPSTT